MHVFLPTIKTQEFPTNIQQKDDKKIIFQARGKYFIQVQGPLGCKALHLSVISLPVGPA